MKNYIAVSADADEVRLAVLSEGILQEYLVERPSDDRFAGNIYKGKVENVLPGMQAAFVDIGLDKNAFLYVADALPPEISDDDQAVNNEKKRSIGDVVKKGQELIVQITKEPVGTKGPRAVRNITLPGRYIVLMPTLDYIGVSRRIQSEAERSRLRELAQSIKPEGMGIIARTVSEGKTAREFEQDVQFLTKLWKKIAAKTKRGPVPACLYRDHDLVYRMVRDIVSTETEHIVIDDESLYEKAIDLIKMLSPDLVGKIELYKGSEPLFDKLGIENQVAKALKHKLWLDCGGYIVIDQTEALTSIDVNTGKFTGSIDLDETVLQANIEAAWEIGRQLRLRNIGGIVVVDFIDMSSDIHRARVLETLEESVKGDRTKTHILGFTSLGLVEMTRKKTNRTLEDLIQRSCPYCEGTGRVHSEFTVAAKIRREIRQWAIRSAEEALLVEVHPSVASVLIGIGGSNLEKLESEIGRVIYIKGVETFHLEEHRFAVVGSREQVSRQAIPVQEGQRLVVKIDSQHVTEPEDGIARVEGFVINVSKAGGLLGKDIPIEITKVMRTYAKATIIN